MTTLGRGHTQPLFPTSLPLSEAGLQELLSLEKYGVVLTQDAPIRYQLFQKTIADAEDQVMSLIYPVAYLRFGIPLCKTTCAASLNFSSYFTSYLVLNRLWDMLPQEEPSTPSRKHFSSHIALIFYAFPAIQTISTKGHPWKCVGH